MEIMNRKNLNIAVVGCTHGKLKLIYNDLQKLELQNNYKIDIVLCCGDFQSMRNKKDLTYMSCPDKYKELGDFHEFYSKNSAPYLTVFIGGNHEASNVLDENFYGGWLCKNIFYLGRAGVINYKGLRIAGISGIYKPMDYYKGYFETKFNASELKSIFHVREYDIVRLSYLTGKIDFFMSHDWPSGSVNKKDFAKILKTHKHWQDELYSGTLGSPASEFLLKNLKPKFWLSGHMHYSYVNNIPYSNKESTTFVALDKTLKNRTYLTVLEYESSLNTDDSNIYFDPEWLSINKVLNEYIPLENKYFDYSNFIINMSDYLKHLQENYNYVFKNQKDSVYPRQELLEELEKHKEEYSKKKIIWEENSYELQRDIIVNTMGINDYHRSKCKYNNINSNSIDNTNKFANKEELNIDIEF